MSNPMEKAIIGCITNAITKNFEKNVLRHSKPSNIKNDMSVLEKQMTEETSVTFQHSGKIFIVRKEYKKFLPLLYGAVLSVNTYMIPGGETFTRFLKNSEGIGLESSDGICFLGLKKKQDGRYYLSNIKEKDYQSL